MWPFSGHQTLIKGYLTNTNNHIMFFKTQALKIGKFPGKHPRSNYFLVRLQSEIKQCLFKKSNLRSTSTPNLLLQPPSSSPLYLFKVNNINTRKRCDIHSELTLNVFHSFFYCFICWLWTGKCLLTLWNIYPFKVNKKIRSQSLHEYL